MYKELIEDIHEYIGFLERCGYSISLSFLKNYRIPYVHELMQYDFHPHSVCTFLKQNPKTAGKCVFNKHALEKKDLIHPYYSCCYAGVEEFLFPLLYEDKIILCIHISGYRGKLARSFSAMENTASLCPCEFKVLYSHLSDKVPSIEQVKAFIKPLQYMFLELYKSCQVESHLHDSLYIRALHYIHENYSKPINCESIAEEFKYSPSYIRYIFKREGNTSVQAKINEIRLNNAKRLLRGTRMTVTEIAFFIGFEDSNYFSTFFKKHEKISPKEYRKRLTL